MRKVDLYGGGLVFVFGLALFFWIIPATTFAGRYYGLSPAFFPRLLAVALCACAVTQILKALVSKINDTAEPLPVSRTGLFRALSVFGLVFASIVLIDLTDVRIGAPVLVIALALLLGERRPAVLAGLAVIPVTIAWVIVTLLLRIPMP